MLVRPKLALVLVLFLVIIPSPAFAMPFADAAGKAVDGIFGQNINLGTVGKDSILMNGWVRGALSIGLGINIDPDTGKVTTSVFDIALNLLVLVPVAGWAMRGGLAAGRMTASAGVRMTGRAAAKTVAGGLAKQAGKTTIKQGLKRFSIKSSFKVGNALTRLGNGMQRAFGTLRGAKRVKTVAKTYFNIFDRTTRSAGKVVRSKLALDLGHKTAWLRNTKGIIPKAKNLLNRLPHLNYKRTVSYLRGSSMAGKTIRVSRHVPLATFVVGGRALSKAWNSFSGHFKTKQSSSYNVTRSMFGKSTKRYTSSYKSTPYKKSYSKSYSKPKSSPKRRSPKRSSSRSSRGRR